MSDRPQPLHRRQPDAGDDPQHQPSSDGSHRPSHGTHDPAGSGAGAGGQHRGGRSHADAAQHETAHDPGETQRGHEPQGRSRHGSAHGDHAAPVGHSAPEAVPASDAEIERLNGDLETAKSQAADLLGALQRERAEFQNFRRRTTEEREREAGLAADYLLKKVLSIADDFDRAIEARPAELAGKPWAEGIAAIDRKLRGLLESEGVRPIEAVGKPFDPREHEAITSVPATGRPDGEVIAEVQRGYRVRDRILRPALVAVAGGDSDEQSPTPPTDTNRTN